MTPMTLSLNRDQLLGLMKDFYLLTNIKIALFDITGNEILAYPEAHNPFCSLVRSCAKGEANCQESNMKSFRRCQKTRKLEIYTCHAGLIETTAPLIDNGSIIGYIMFGQITDISDPEKLTNMLMEVIDNLDIEKKDITSTIQNISMKSTEQIQATAKILEACTFYVLLKDMVTLQRETFISNLNQYLLNHISEDLSVDRLTEEFHISKNKLYDSCNRYLPVGIAEHIKALRIEEAKRLLKETDLTVYQISDQVGFNDYNYFCRVFKKEVGLSAKKYRQLK